MDLRWEANPRHAAWEAAVLALNYAHNAVRLVEVGRGGKGATWMAAKLRGACSSKTPPHRGLGDNRQRSRANTLSFNQQEKAQPGGLRYRFILLRPLGLLLTHAMQGIIRIQLKVILLAVGALRIVDLDEAGFLDLDRAARTAPSLQGRFNLGQLFSRCRTVGEGGRIAES